jgi:hypothetical protein
MVYGLWTYFSRFLLKLHLHFRPSGRSSTTKLHPKPYSMKKYLLPAVSLGALIFGASRIKKARTQRKEAAAAPRVSPLAGTWKLLTGRFTASDNHSTNNDWNSGTITQYKIVTPDSFMYYSMRNNSESIQWAAMGKVRIEGDRYTEHIQSSNAKGLPGRTMTFNYRLEGDRWYHSADTTEGRLEEVWVRVK